MQRFHLPSIDFKSDSFEITENRIVYQTGKVLRMWKDDFFHIFDEEKEYLVQIEDINKRKILVKKVQEIKNDTEPHVKVALYQAIPKKPALFEMVVQKATELGVSEIYPLITERTENRRMSKFDRLQLIAMEATEQCGRIKIPSIHHPVNYDEVVGKLSNAYIAYEYEEKECLGAYSDKLRKASEVQVLIGPEGGLSEQEISLAKESPAVHSFTLGPRILRTETAAIATLALIFCATRSA